VVLGTLLDHGVSKARTFVESWLPLPLQSNATARELAETAVRLLIEHADDAGWSVVWPAIQTDTEFGMSVVEITFGGIGYGKVPRLTEDQTADLYIWLVKHYPHGEDQSLRACILSVAG